MKKTVWFILICLITGFASIASADPLSTTEALAGWPSALWQWLDAVAQAISTWLDSAPLADGGSVSRGDVTPIPAGPGIISNG